MTFEQVADESYEDTLNELTSTILQLAALLPTALHVKYYKIWTTSSKQPMKINNF
jgi:hypothetical protein